MKVKTIRRGLDKKFREFLESIDDDEVLNKLKEKGMDKIDSVYLVEVIDRIF